MFPDEAILIGREWLTWFFVSYIAEPALHWEVRPARSDMFGKCSGLEPVLFALFALFALSLDLVEVDRIAVCFAGGCG